MGRERELELALKDEITAIFKDDKFLNEKGELKSINSYKHSPPNNYYAQESGYAPYIISEVVGSKEDDESYEIQVAFTLCVCDGIIEGVENINQNIHCEDDLFHMKQKIVERFKKNSVLNKKFVCTNAWEFGLVQDLTAPLYYAGLTTKFNAVKIETEIGYNEELL